MHASGWLMAAWVFGGVGIALLATAVSLGFWWWKNPLQDKTPTELSNLGKDIQTLTGEIRNLVKLIEKHYKN